jgi:small subunit ribosomal protein S7
MNADAIAALEQAAAGEDAMTLVEEGLRFHMPTPPGKHEQLQDRHHPVVHQVTRMLMRDGKLSKAQKVRQIPLLPVSFTLLALQHDNGEDI